MISLTKFMNSAMMKKISISRMLTHLWPWLNDVVEAMVFFIKFHIHGRWIRWTMMWWLPECKMIKSKGTFELVRLLDDVLWTNRFRQMDAKWKPISIFLSFPVGPDFRPLSKTHATHTRFSECGMYSDIAICGAIKNCVCLLLHKQWSFWIRLWRA